MKKEALKHIGERIPVCKDCWRDGKSWERLKRLLSGLIDTSTSQIAITSIEDEKKGEKIVLLLEGNIDINGYQRFL